eukprot:Gb_16880 [translate_table: standard]
MTSRKIINDTYGEWGAHGGGAFSGEDPTKVYWSGAYVILFVFIGSYGIGRISDKEILNIIIERIYFGPGMIAIDLDLERGGNQRFQKTIVYGHFGKDGLDLTWEVLKPIKVMN